MALNVLSQPLQECCRNPLTGYYRNGFCDTGAGDRGLHIICVRVTPEFLEFSRNHGNDLTTPRPEYEFPGLRDGDCWCLCISRWMEAEKAGCAPRVCLQGSHISCLEFVDLDLLKRYRV